MTMNAAQLDELVTQKTLSAGTSFYWAMRLLESKRRLAMYAVYAYCREIDDIVDEAGEETEKNRRLELWVTDLDRLYQGQEPEQDLAAALRKAIAAYDLPKADFLAIIDGCRMDLNSGLVRPKMAVLDLYCDRVASAVGRLSVRIFGDFRDASLVLANHQGRALQLTNILRDVAVDAKIGRVYLPDELLSRYDIIGHDIEGILAHPSLPDVCRDLAEIAEEHYIKARAALKFCSRRAVKPAVIMMEMYWQIFRQCRAIGWRPQSAPKSLPKSAKLWCAIRHGFF